jgi:hypothetical protein
LFLLNKTESNISKKYVFLVLSDLIDSKSLFALLLSVYLPTKSVKSNCLLPWSIIYVRSATDAGYTALFCKAIPVFDTDSRFFITTSSESIIRVGYFIPGSMIILIMGVLAGQGYLDA